jgi:CRISPR-associated endonuclease/helicase Cas3
MRAGSAGGGMMTFPGLISPAPSGIMTFPEFFFAATKRDDRPGFDPFDWQTRLARQVTESDPGRVEWPTVAALPTAAGKTSLLLIAVYALAVHPQAHRRIAYVVDRRIVVDEAFDLAKRLCRSLEGPDAFPELAPFAATLREKLQIEDGAPLLEAHMLRGGTGEPLARLSSPLTPTIMVGTVDQLGSRLLFRGYGVSDGMRPISAGLLAYDTLWILDEAHLSRAFAETLGTVQHIVGRTPSVCPRSIHVVEVSATPRVRSSVGVFKLGVPDQRIRPRIETAKRVKLLTAQPGKTADEIVRFVGAALAAGKRRVGVIVNRVALARRIFDLIEKRVTKAKGERLLFIGPIRPFDRDRLYEMPAAQALKAQAPRDFGRPIVAVCTQTVEVGADLDFDALVVAGAPLDVLRQRFGRMDRLGLLCGASMGAIVFEESAKADPIYGEATTETRQWLQTIASDGRVDFGIATLSLHVDALDVTTLDRLCAPAPQGEPLDRRHERNLARTRDAFVDDPDVGIFLHGNDGAGDVQIVWRADLREPDESTGDVPIDDWRQAVEAAPPCSRESLTVPLYAAKAFLRNRPSDLADVPGDLDIETESKKRHQGRSALRWRAGGVVDKVGVRDLVPGDTLVVPATYGGADRYGWAPDSPEPVQDLAVEAYVQPSRALFHLQEARAIRLRLSLVADDGDESLGDRVEAALLDFTARGSSVEAEMAAILLRGRSRRTVARVDRGAWVSWRRSLDDDRAESSNADDSSFTVEIPLRTHSLHVSKRSRTMAIACGLPPEISDQIARAGLLHDLGKADERFQIMLRGGDFLGVMGGQTLAKGLRRSREQKPTLPTEDQWQRGMRHEAISVAMLPDGERMLVRHLIGSHHGYGRPGYPIIEDHAPRRVSFSIKNELFEGPSDRHQQGDWDEQFGELLDRYGTWGLAYIEAILRLADHRCSQEEERGVADDA